MRRGGALILSVLMLLSLAACSRTPQPSQQDQEERYLVRQEVQTVYGVESPAVEDEQVFQMAAATDPAAQQVSASSSQEMRAVWFSYLTLEPMIKGRTQAQFSQSMAVAFQNVAQLGCDTVFVQVRPFGDAFYHSQYFPWSSYLTGEEGKNPGYDPLEILCSLADEYGLRIEAWLNPYRVRAAYATTPMSAQNPAQKWLDAGTGDVLTWNQGVYYNPASASAQELIVNGVREIVQNYDVDGIHFDDYFYPTTDPSFDAVSYQASGTNLSQADWRRENVNQLVRRVYAAIKELDPDCVFGISPQGNNRINYEEQYADTALWLSNPGYVDYICPQIYYGYQNSTCPYAETVAEWDEMIQTEGIRLYVGLAAYKLGQEDTWAGEGKREWIGTTNLLARMVQTARSAQHYGGVALYPYESLFPVQPTQQLEQELQNLEIAFH